MRSLPGERALWVGEAGGASWKKGAWAREPARSPPARRAVLVSPVLSVQARFASAASSASLAGRPALQLRLSDPPRPRVQSTADSPSPGHSCLKGLLCSLETPALRAALARRLSWASPPAETLPNCVYRVFSAETKHTGLQGGAHARWQPCLAPEQTMESQSWPVPAFLAGETRSSSGGGRARKRARCPKVSTPRPGRAQTGGRAFEHF